MKVKLLPLAGFGVAATSVLAEPVQLLLDGSWQAAGDALVSNLKSRWPVYLGVPIGIGIAGTVAKGMRANPGLSFGKGFSVRLF